MANLIFVNYKMSCFSIRFSNLFQFLFVYADSANSQAHYYITPSLSVHCPGDPCSTHITNSGSLYIFNNNLNFSGYTRLENCAEQSNKTAEAREEGGAITSFQSTVIFTGVSSLLNNQARHGEAILAIESKIMTD